MKTCYKCKKEKPLSDFCKDRSSKDGLNSKCKSCRRKYYLENRERILALANKWNADHKELVCKRASQWQKVNREATRAASRKWDQKNKLRMNAYNRKKWQEDVQFRLRNNLRRRITKAIQRKREPTLNYLGCSLEFYMDYLASNFDEKMSWENYGSYWEIDHIIPLNEFNLLDPEQLEVAFHYSNTQPLTCSDNRSKGSSLAT